MKESKEPVFVTGNPILEVITHYKKSIDQSIILDKLAISKGKYFLVTIHRAENVDIKNRLVLLIESLITLRKIYGIPVICSLHPRTKDKIQEFQLDNHSENIQFHAPFGFFDFIRLEQDAFCVLSDSGTVQEECCLLHTPNVTLRDVTERPETIECGSNVLSGINPKDVVRCVHSAISGEVKWSVPEEYLNKNVSDTVNKIVCGFYQT